MMIEKALYELSSQAEQRQVFWHYVMPVNYYTDKIFSGINFLLLGVDKKTLLDPRWGILQEYTEKKVIISKDAEVRNILYWSQETPLYKTLYPVPVINVADTSDYTYYQKNYTFTDLYRLISSHRISYVESDNSSFSPLNNTLYLNTEILDPNDQQEQYITLKNALPAIAKYIVGNSLDVIKKAGIYLNADSYPFYLILLQDLVLYKIAYQINFKLNTSIDNDTVCDCIQYFYIRNLYKELLSIFNIADLIVEDFFNRKEKVHKILQNFMPREETFHLLKTLSRQEINNLVINMEKAKKAKDYSNAYLHFFFVSESLVLNFYVTHYDPLKEDCICGMLLHNNEEPEFISYTPWDLCGEMQIDSLFKPDRISNILSGLTL